MADQITDQDLARASATRLKVPNEIERYRIRDGMYGSPAGEDWGAFVVPGPCGVNLRILVSAGDDNENIPWDHVSVSTLKRTPNWHEMCFVKELFWDSETTVMQLHPPRSTWINNHPFCLHLWRPVLEKIPLPPPIAVGLKDFNL